jgi:phosphohistidine phosphatase
MTEYSNMDLILWRHAEAEDGYPDMARALTPHGHLQALASAKWLLAHMPANTHILVSPAVRAQQTAKALDLPFETVNALAPEQSAQAMLAAIQWPNHPQAVLVVGHQPTLGEVAAFTMTESHAMWSVKKSAIWWLSYRLRGFKAQAVIKAVINPDILMKNAYGIK